MRHPGGLRATTEKVDQRIYRLARSDNMQVKNLSDFQSGFSVP